MQNKFIGSIIIIFSLILIYSCKSDNSNQEEEIKDSLEIIETNDQTKSDSTISIIDSDSIKKIDKKEVKKLMTKFICPQGDPEGNMDYADNCPVCDMELIENPDYITKNSKK